MDFYRSRIGNPLNSVIEHYYEEVIAQENEYEHEQQLSICIQSKYRMFRLRKQYQRFRKASLLVQKFLRGTLARLLVKRNASDVKNIMSQRYFSNQAILIQKFFRGYYKRKYFHEFKARKQYLLFLKEKNQQFRVELSEYEQQELEQKQQLEETFAREEFNRIAANLHHLSSTRIQPGVYNRPLASPEMVFDLKVESHLQTVFHQHYSTIKKNQKIRYHQIEERDAVPENMAKSLINGGGGSMKSLRPSKHFNSMGKLKLAPL